MVPDLSFTAVARSAGGAEVGTGSHLRGEAVADLVPAQDNKRTDAIVAVDEMLLLMQARKPAGDIDIKAIINEGRA